MRCPKDANYTKRKSPYCMLISPHNRIDGLRSICTRPKGHQGKHHNHDGKNKCKHVWED